jgi:hypothetical protein
MNPACPSFTTPGAAASATQEPATTADRPADAAPDLTRSG